MINLQVLEEGVFGEMNNNKKNNEDDNNMKNNYNYYHKYITNSFNVERNGYYRESAAERRIKSEVG